MKIENCRKCESHIRKLQERFTGDNHKAQIVIDLVACKEIKDFLIIAEGEVYNCPREKGSRNEK